MSKCWTTSRREPMLPREAVACEFAPTHLGFADTRAQQRSVGHVRRFAGGTRVTAVRTGCGVARERVAVSATEVRRVEARSDPAMQETTLATAVPPHGPHSSDRVEQVLRLLPSHGWTAGWIGRRDRALLVLSHLAGLSYDNIAALTAGDLTVADGVATIHTPGGETLLRDNADDLLCGPCALARWVHALDLTVVYPDGRVIAAVIARAVRLTPDSPHLCHSNNAITEITRGAAAVDDRPGGTQPG